MILLGVGVRGQESNELSVRVQVRLRLFDVNELSRFRGVQRYQDR